MVRCPIEFYEDEVSKFKGEKEPIERPQRPRIYGALAQCLCTCSEDTEGIIP